MDYLGKIEETPERIENIKNSSKPEFTPIEFRIESINVKFPEKIDIFICGFRKIK